MTFPRTFPHALINITLIYCNSLSYPFYLDLHLRLIIAESISCLCAEVVTAVLAVQLNYLSSPQQLKFRSAATVEGFTCKFLCKHSQMRKESTLPLMMHSNARFTLDESRALVSRIAICSFSAKFAASSVLTSLIFAKSVLFPMSIRAMLGCPCSLNSCNHFPIFSNDFIFVMS